MQQNKRTLPSWLADFDAFTAHLDEQLVDDTSHTKGLRFVTFAAQILPQTPQGSGYGDFTINEKLSHDKGIDILTGIAADGSMLLTQSKFHIRRVDEIDTIVSNFEAYDLEHFSDPHSQQGSLFDIEARPTIPRYLIVTSSRVSTILERYRKSRKSSRAFFDTLEREKRIEVVAGPDLLAALQGTYRKAFDVPSELTISAASKQWLHAGSVRLGVVSGRELVRLYQQHGDGLFFENVRTFLGFTSNNNRESVNQRILKTVEDSPHEMLERNNGITIRADTVVASSDQQLLLKNASIVNGCQTTMCIVAKKGEIDDRLMVPVKIVESDDLWEVAHSANYQNSVHRVDLELAKFLRPQLVQKAAARVGVGLEPDQINGLSDLIATIGSTQVTYDETKALYQGIFSDRPTNIFQNNYTSLRTNVLAEIYEREDVSESLFAALFMISKACRHASEEGAEIYEREDGVAFKRFRKPSYRAYISLLALGAMTRFNLADSVRDPRQEADRILAFLRKVEEILENRMREFVDVYLTAYEVLSVAGMSSTSDQYDESKTQQQLFRKISDTPYDVFYNSLVMRLQREEARRRAPER